MHFLSLLFFNFKVRAYSRSIVFNMSGKYDGVQAIIRQRCSFIEYVPCTAHLHNPVGTSAAACCSATVEFFDLQNLYSWLISSTYRWRKHREKLADLPVQKALSNTRWSARYDAVSALYKGCRQNLAMLEEFSKDEDQPADSRIEAKGFQKKLKLLETAILLELWDTRLTKLNCFC